jgi:hypothetical protein
MTRHGVRWIVALTALNFLAANSASAAVLYREDFSSTPPATDVGLDTVGWTNVDAEGGGDNLGIYDTFVYYFSNVAMADMTFRTALFSTTELSGAPISLATPDLAISWATRMEHQFSDTFVDQSGTGSGADVQAAIQAGGQWYVSDQAFNTGNVISGTYSPPSVQNLAGATWSLLDGVDGLPGVSIGAAGVPADSITGIGLVVTSVQRQSINFDYVEISGVPEPATLGLCACAGLGLLVRRRLRATH